MVWPPRSTHDVRRADDEPLAEAVVQVVGDAACSAVSTWPHWTSVGVVAGVGRRQAAARVSAS